jgi:tRNA A-37 threonylcarbamoyl transferase component Bud32
MYKYQDAQERIHQLDPSLTLIERLGPSTVAVYLVENAEGKHVLKMPRDYKGQFSTQLTQRDNCLITREQAILKLLQGVNGITQMQKKYINNDQAALLKDYQEGDTLSDYKPTAEDFNALEKTISQIHRRGIARLKLNDSDIIKSFDRLKQPIIIDTGLGIISSDKSISKRQFDKEAEKDYKLLKLLFDIRDY